MMMMMFTPFSSRVRSLDGTVGRRTVPQGNVTEISPQHITVIAVIIILQCYDTVGWVI